MPRILLVDDNVRYCRVLADQLGKVDFIVNWAANASDFDALAVGGDYDLFLIDLTLPDGDGVDLVRHLRRKNVKAPIIIVSARSEVPEKVRGLELGADDFVTKPFSANELIARVKAILRRPPVAKQHCTLAGKLLLDRSTDLITYDGKILELSPAERRLLSALIQRVGRVVPREALFGSLQSGPGDSSPNAVEQHISRLRKALKLETMRVKLETVRGIGYILQEFRP